ncbi:serine protease inhibitor 42Dd-like isoform X2 [Topomyia yanbarensis]|uniref:serine protease inhibitor 42Dd-like isoform X2 n=1 Tax=Topomyia yanbarensis TaxID=2498891 RepID=UPI00273BEE03|nr:serine protease inhibitor 42Dd-like isoform X2 [Topomyia yanbarensis]
MMLGIPYLLFVNIFFLVILNPSKYIAMAKLVDDQFVRKTNDFALELYKQIISVDKKNVVISPFSISTCLSFAAMGAAGSTAEELFSAMKYGTASEKEKVAESYGNVLANLDSNKSLKTANKMYIMEKYSVKQKFRDIAVEKFRSDAEHINFTENSQAAKTINSWVEQKTNDKIKDLISPDVLDENTRMVLVNAIHFKGTWAHQFNPDVTRPMPFWISATESVDVPMMNTKKHFKHGVFEDLGLAALELTYSDSDVSMLILLPNERDGLAKLEDNMASIDIPNMLTKMYSQEVELFLPKFKIEFDIDLKDTLEKLGMGKMFTDQADFSDMLEQAEPLKVSNVVHKAFIEVNEEGAEAAAATAAVVRMKRSCQLVTPFHANRPFVCIIQIQTRIIFIGKITNPDRSHGRHEEL